MLRGSFQRLLASIQTVKGIGPATARKLRARGLETLEDALFFLPLRYQDRRSLTPIGRLAPGGEAVVKGRIVSLKKGLKGRHPAHLVLADQSGRVTATWFGLSAAAFEGLAQGQELTLAGRVDTFQGRPVLVHPEMVNPKDEAAELGRFVPVYRDIPGLSARSFRRLIRTILKGELGRLDSPLPAGLVEQEGLLDLAEAFRRVHFPQAEEEASLDGLPRRTLTFTELFLFQAGLALSRREHRDRRAPALETFDQVRRRVAAALPFNLTRAQERVLDELARDLAQARPMSRLLQGDVGSGKTIVAVVALLAAAGSGRQAALMAPTEILAEQHYRRLAPQAEAAGVSLGLLTGRLGARERRECLQGLAEGRIGLVVGTHALIQDKVSFERLALVVIDEQHRFGVMQRAALSNKGLNPHLLVMTATPIPRSLALTLFGDLDVSVLDEKPPGRRQVITRLLRPSRLDRAWRAIQGAVDRGLQAYVVLPAIEPGEGLVSAEERYAQLRAALPGLRFGLIHGRLDKEAQSQEMRRFAGGEVDVLVATTVVEVGLDVPRAALMIIENAERFGLAQIHQLRGRVGRGGSEAACLLISEASGPSRQRLKLLETTDDGFKIAEADLQFRGPGEFLGTSQTGWPDFRLANLMTDSRLLDRARRAAFGLIQGDPGLEAAEHAGLKEILNRRWLRRLKLSQAG